MSLAAVLVAGLVAGCSPSSFLARRMIDAPNRVPGFLKPEGRVLLRWPAGLLERFPSGTNVVGHPPAGLRWVIVEPADFRTETRSEPRDRQRTNRVTFRFSFQLPAAGLPPPKPAVGTAFLLHGYGVDLETLLPLGVFLAEAGWRSVLVDLRGHGSSGGRQVSFGVRETEDLRELRAALAQEGRVGGPCVAVGHSLGAALALRWAAQDPEVEGAVALGPFAEFVPAALRLRSEYAKWVPRGWVRRAAEKVPGLLGVERANLDPVSVVQNRAVHALLIASAADVITPPEDAAVLESTLGPRGELLIVGGATHETLPYAFGQHGETLRQWLSALGTRSMAGRSKD